MHVSSETQRHHLLLVLGGTFTLKEIQGPDPNRSPAEKVKQTVAHQGRERSETRCGCLLWAWSVDADAASPTTPGVVDLCNPASHLVYPSVFLVLQCLAALTTSDDDKLEQRDVSTSGNRPLFRNGRGTDR